MKNIFLRTSTFILTTMMVFQLMVMPTMAFKDTPPDSETAQMKEMISLLTQLIALLTTYQQQSAPANTKTLTTAPIENNLPIKKSPSKPVDTTKVVVRSPYISGTVMVGPTCPVVSEPALPECADRPYATDLAVRLVGSEDVFKKFSSNTEGKFKVEVPAGSYTIGQLSTSKFIEGLTRCYESETIVVKENGYANVAISCDNGMR